MKGNATSFAGDDQSTGIVDMAGVFEAMPNPVMVLDGGASILATNAAFRELFGLAPQEFFGIDVTALPWLLPEAQAPWQKALVESRSVCEQGLRLSGDDRVFAVQAVPVAGLAGPAGGPCILVSFADVTSFWRDKAELSSMLDEIHAVQREIERRNRELEQLASVDPLTGCLNRRIFMERMQQLVSLAAERAQPVSLLMLDLDHFKQVNDHHGHQAGDQVLAGVAAMLGRISREQDLVCRYGGEEFALLLPDTDLDQCLQIAERIREHVAQLAEGGTLAVERLTVSIGAATCGGASDLRMSLIESADRALYQAKHAGRDRVCLFDPDCQRDADYVFRQYEADAGDSDVARKARLEDLRTRLQRLHHSQRVKRPHCGEAGRESGGEELQRTGSTKV